MHLKSDELMYSGFHIGCPYCRSRLCTTPKGPQYLVSSPPFKTGNPGMCSLGFLCSLLNA